MQAVTEERQWAVGLSNEDFTNEYLRRFPRGADCVPTVNDYLNVEVTEDRGIKPFNPEDMTDDIDKPEKKADSDAIYCRGCKREFKSLKGKQLARAAHERRCKAFLSIKI